MASINGVTIKSLKEFKGHEGEPCFQGNVYVGNKKIGFWSQDSRGAICDDFYFDEPYSEKLLADRIEELNKDKAVHGTRRDGSEYTLEYSLEHLFTDIISLMDDEKMFKKAQKAGYAGLVILTDGFHVIGWRLDEKYMTLSDENLQKVLSKEIEETKKTSLFEESEYNKHQIKIYRDLSDFNIGIPVTLKDISRNLSIDEKIKKSTKQSTPPKKNKECSLNK